MLMGSATVSVLDETGKAIATGKAVNATTGAYNAIPLTGAGPFRVQACGTAGDRVLCVWGVTTKGGTLNLTPLTTAVTVLASGQSPETLMTGAVAPGLTDSALAAAQIQLRTALASALADAGLDASFDLLNGPLTPGSHTGYDRMLDNVAVVTGLDGKAFVSLSTPLGSGVAYLEPGTTTGSFSIDPAAASIDYAGVDALYKSLGKVMPFSAKCADQATGVTPLLDANVRASANLVSAAFVGPKPATAPLCGHMTGLLYGDVESLEGSTLLPSTPSRCDFSGTDPVCRVNLVFKTPKNAQHLFGVEQAVVKRSSGWFYLGNRLEVQATATARLVMTHRVDQTATDTYARYLDVPIPAYPGLQCARVSQKDTSGADAALALFKPDSGDATFLSLWRTSASNVTPSLDAANGATLGADAVTIALPISAAGNAVVRNFARAGRTLKVELFADAACSAPLPGADNGAVSIDVAGQLPLSLLNSQPWPTLTSNAALLALKGVIGKTNSYAAAWTFQRPSLLAMKRVQLCADAACTTTLSQAYTDSTILKATLDTAVSTQPLLAGDYKLLRLTGRTADGLTLQLDNASCPAKPAGQAC